MNIGTEWYVVFVLFTWWETWAVSSWYFCVCTMMQPCAFRDYSLMFTIINFLPNFLYAHDNYSPSLVYKVSLCMERLTLQRINPSLVFLLISCYPCPFVQADIYTRTQQTACLHFLLTPPHPLTLLSSTLFACSQTSLLVVAFQLYFIK